MSIENRWRNIEILPTPGGSLSVELATLGSARSGEAYQIRYSMGSEGEVTGAQGRIVPASTADGGFGTPSATYPHVVWLDPAER